MCEMTVFEYGEMVELRADCDICNCKYVCRTCDDEKNGYTYEYQNKFVFDDDEVMKGGGDGGDDDDDDTKGGGGPGGKKEDMKGGGGPGGKRDLMEWNWNDSEDDDFYDFPMERDFPQYGDDDIDVQDQ